MEFVHDGVRADRFEQRGQVRGVEVPESAMVLVTAVGQGDQQ